MTLFFLQSFLWLNVCSSLQAHAYLADWVHTIGIDDVNKEAASLLAFASHYGKEAEAMHDFEENTGKYAELGPSRATSVVACYPAYTDLSGESIGELLLTKERQFNFGTE